MNEEKAYAAPEAELLTETNQEDNLASRGARLGAAIVDGLLLGIISTVLFFTFGIMSFDGSQPGLGQLVLMFLLIVPVYLLLNGVLLHKYGQTIGKKLLGIKVVRMQDQKPSLKRLVLVRWMVIAFLGYIPLIGPVLGLVNILFIFGSEKRCLHDRLADTKVVVA